ncbi:amino acid transporter [Metallosphaera yellowstonensis MK1]|jgi:amino acid transporter|uniref:Amino acid transporter n=1 Tax=Metallosphaera yellowstonensis MK1 TaxID=671065 RepID=H2C5Z0_9CREN|nr:APC family permease [Metallosphaera yellowstonensis]EHP69217.1 amino acid transporter [Metallosphaera yellowstonensis MK1]
MRLSRGSISLKETYGQAMAVTAPLGSVVSTSTAAILYAGHSVVFTTLLALMGSALWIYTLTSYTRRIASAGGYYTFGYSAWRNKFLSFFEALTEVFAYSFLNAVNVITLYLLINIGLGILGFTLPWWSEGVILAFGILYPTLLSLTQIKKVLGYVVSVSATAEVVLLVALFLVSLREPFHLEYLTPDGASPNNIAQAFVLSMVSISGAGAATYLGEEAKKPMKTITQGMWLSLLIGGLSMFLGTYALVTLWGGSLSDLANSPQPLLFEMYRYGSIPMFIALVMSANSLLASNIGTTLGSARILFNLGREGAAPRFLTNVTKSGEPLVSTLLVALLSALVVALFTSVLGLSDAFAIVGVITGIFWLMGRVIDGFGVPVFYARISQLSVYTLLIPIIATSLNVWGIIQSIQPNSISLFTLVALLSVIVVWYSAKGRRGRPGSLVVDEENRVITIEEYMDRLKKKAPVT